MPVISAEGAQSHTGGNKRTRSSCGDASVLMHGHSYGRGIPHNAHRPPRQVRGNHRRILSTQGSIVLKRFGTRPGCCRPSSCMGPVRGAGWSTSPASGWISRKNPHAIRPVCNTADTDLYHQCHGRSSKSYRRLQRHKRCCCCCCWVAVVQWGPVGCVKHELLHALLHAPMGQSLASMLSKA